MKNKYLAYTTDYVSFLFETLDLEKVKTIILFGSVAKNEATEESDIDLFIDVVGNEKEYKKIIDNSIEQFHKSKFFTNYWKIKGVTNDFNLIIGKLQDWKDLKNSILTTGITLYSKYKETPTDSHHSVLIAFENIKPESKRATLNKKLYGFNSGKKHYAGLLETYHGFKLNKGTILIPLEHKTPFLNLFKKMNITVKIKNVLEY